MSEPRIVYFSSVTEATRQFVEKLGYPAERIELRATDESLSVDYDYILATPTYGAGKPKGAVPKQVVKFLKPLEHRKHCLGILAGGNKNFGGHFVLAGRVLSDMLNVPLIHSFEVSGTRNDVREAREKIDRIWNDTNKPDSSAAR